MVKYQKFAFDNFVLDEDNQPYPADWENNHIEVEPPAEELETTQIPEPELVMETASEPEVVPAEPEVIEEIVTYREEEVAEKEAKAKKEGYEEGYNQAQAEAETKRLAILENINAQLLRLTEQEGKQNQEVDNRVIELSRAVVHKLVPVLEKENAEALIKDFLTENFPNFKNEIKLSFYFNPETIKYVQEEISHLANANDFEGKISLHKDASMLQSDCRIEWDNGGVERNGTKMLDKIDKIFDSNKSKD